MHTPALKDALTAWASLVGKHHVVADAPELDLASTGTFATGGRALAILRPGNRDEVQSVVRIANRFRIPIYPFSTGKNWGYGSRVPVTDGVLLDLGRLNRILDFDESLAYVTLEPGVTQRQLFAFLRDRGSRLWMDATGASPDCSIIGNTLERGFGHTPMGDHCANVCGLEVVLPTGDCIDTGFARFPSARTGALSRWGIGPSVDGLFSQSSLGIVTRMTVWLMPQPEHFQAFFFMSDREDGLAEIVDALRPLRLDGTLRSVMHIANDYKVVTATGRRHSIANGSPPIDRGAMRALRQNLGVGTWNGSGGLYGTKAQVREARRRVKRALAGKVMRLRFVDDRLLAVMGRFARPFRMFTGWDVSHTLKVIEPVYNLMRGVPTDSTLASTYWRKPAAVPVGTDPDADGCGLLWCSPVVPNTGRDLGEVTALAEAILLQHGFEPQISVSLTTERSSVCVITISYDRAMDGEDARAFECYRSLTEALLARGYPPYRLNVASMALLESADPTYAEALSRIKNALDPNGILAPGRYEPVRTAAAELS